VPNVTRTLGVTTETVCVWRDGSVMARHARLKKEEEDVSTLALCCNFCISKVQKSASDASLYRLVIWGRCVW